MPRPGKHVLSTVKSQETSALISTEKKNKRCPNKVPGSKNCSSYINNNSAIC